MKKILLILIIVLLISGCYHYEDVEAPREPEEKEDYWKEINASCVYDFCNDKCGIELFYDMMDWDYNKNGEIDDLEWEIMQQAQDRDRECSTECNDGWRNLEECIVE